MFRKSNLKKTAGKRKTADELLAAVAFWNVLWVLGTAAVTAIILFSINLLQAAFSFLIGGLIVALLSTISWFSEIWITRYLANLQKFVFPLAYLLKISLLFCALPIIRAIDLLELNFVIAGIFLGMILTLVVTSVIILRAEGPDFDLPTECA
ncbi:hypothetical protein [Arcanobacterium hippocoleae]|uniref:F0F1-type ATP synthase assembly protein I n=1 Tax=Arcanobacterium hippocoleae TaxID=149017 RepID=A0ABU1T3L5_9ACTO|nr:hypothetical protein [Arcanobacterium hippocoleae]MDR6939977.1 F0F1-type ATP synthase assembly protein I [Arcanobacterium hippocoleae]